MPLRKFGQCVSAPPGRRTVNTEPLPGSLATVTSPPIMRASLREMARAKACPAVAARGEGIGLGEILKQFCLLLRRHADAGIGNGKLDPVASVGHLAHSQG